MSRATGRSTLQILFESKDEYAVYKPKGMACEKRIDIEKDSLVAILTETLNQQIYLPHRLDAVTCGIVLAARSKEAVAFHNKQIADRLWKKHYIARVTWPDGFHSEQLIGRHKAFLKRKGNRSVVVASGGAPSFLEILAIEPVQGAPHERHVLVRLLTGRYHQIRAMFQAMGIPLCGDPMYPGGNQTDESFYLEHASLGFVSMQDGKWQRIITPRARLDEPVGERLYKKLCHESTI
ncbi:MAG: hypothetical protein JXX29_18815 [Deltaproteobacteria bacterium]|nr:hypothetical protein [Deltaproteobacteria bacterium]MBN2673739.1 hypothetical protein [Deltaproteobacteria bacterium]